jgi:hypothetical protein
MSPSEDKVTSHWRKTYGRGRRLRKSVNELTGGEGRVNLWLMP